MTAPMMTLAELAEKGPDVDVLRQRVQFMAQRLMDIDVEGRCGAGYDEKAHGARRNSRNGDRQRLWETRAGSVAPCSLKAFKPSAILLRLGCLLCGAEHRVHHSPSGLWTYTARWDTIHAGRLVQPAADTTARQHLQDFPSPYESLESHQAPLDHLCCLGRLRSFNCLRSSPVAITSSRSPLRDEV
jgi:hypothetical protein